MRRIPLLLQAATTSLAIAGLLGATVAPTVQAGSANQPSLTISQLKITSSNGQFVTLYNTTDAPLDMTKYQLEYFNSYDLSKATSSRLIALQGTLPPHSYYQLNDGALMLCYQMLIDSVSLGFSSTAGFVQIVSYNQERPGSIISPATQDFIGWSKTAVTGAQTLPSITSAFLQRQPFDVNNNPLVSSPGFGSWRAVQQKPGKDCELVTVQGLKPVTASLNQLLVGSEPPVTFASVDSGTQTSVVFSAVNLGLMAPRISELLPNPDGTGTDATDEFIELYNPNNVPFDLAGFTLQTGLTTLKSYVFPAGTILPPQSFRAFFSEVTSLSLSNTSSQAQLLDPAGTNISSSEVYKTAKDGQSWALANGAWVFTTQSTPNSANIIKVPITTSKKTAATKAKTAKKVANGSAAKSKIAKAPTAAFQDEEPVVAPIHVRVLALVAAAAVLYGAYEYRSDIRNRVRQFRRYITHRSPAGS